MVFVARAAHLQAVRTRGLRVDSILADFVVAPAQATGNPAAVGAVDVVLLGVKARQVREAARALWHKLITIVATGGIGAITRMPVGDWRAVPQTRAMYGDLVREVHAIALARGIRVADEDVQFVMQLPHRLEPEATMSLQRDIAEGRPAELEQQLGFVVRAGRDVGIDPAISSFIYHSLLPGELRARAKTANGPASA